ncbi:MAG: response regulator transcription factor [Oscillospiraceae bacterium]|nr:response regulator transcription factor [Oscillospiraceae bacterium]
MKLTIAICDDEVTFLDDLYNRVEQIVSKYNYKCNIIEFDNSGEFTNYCKKNIVDIILADIDIPDKDGFTAVKELQEQQPDIPVIFVSAHEELAYQSFYYNPFQFVSKADLDRLEHVLIDLIQKIERRKQQKDIVHIEAEGNIVDINVNEVMYLKSDRNYIMAYNENENVLLKFRGILKSIYAQLSDSGFIYTHKSYIINCRFIQNFERKKVVLANNSEIKGTRNTDIIDEAQKLYGKFMRELRW